MGPKKKKGKGKDTMVGGYSVEEMTEVELKDYAQKLQESLQQSQDEIEHFQTEKSGIEHAWEASKQHLAEKAKLLCTKIEELKDFRITSKKLLEEMDHKLDYVKREDVQDVFNEVVKDNLDQLQCERTHLRLERNASKRVLRKEGERINVGGAYEKLIQNVRQTRCEQIGQLIEYHEWKLDQVSVKYEDQYEKLWDMINEERLFQFKIAEESRNEQIHMVDQKRTKEFQRVRNYFTRISFDCLALIGDLKHELENKKKKATKQKNLLNQTASTNKKLHQQMKEVEEAREILASYPDDKLQFSLNRDVMMEYMQIIKDLELGNHMVSGKLVEITKQKKNLELQFLAAVKQLQQSTTLKSVYLEKHLKALTKLLEKKKLEVKKPIETKETTMTKEKPKIRRSPTSTHPKMPSRSLNVVNLVFRDTMVRFKPPPNIDF